MVMQLNLLNLQNCLKRVEVKYILRTGLLPCPPAPMRGNYDDFVRLYFRIVDRQFS